MTFSSHKLKKTHSRVMCCMLLVHLTFMILNYQLNYVKFINISFMRCFVWDNVHALAEIIMYMLLVNEKGFKRSKHTIVLD